MHLSPLRIRQGPVRPPAPPSGTFILQSDRGVRGNIQVQAHINLRWLTKKHNLLISQVRKISCRQSRCTGIFLWRKMEGA